MKPFKWTKKRSDAAMFLAQAYTIREAAEQVGVQERTIYMWKNNPEFSAEVDRLSLMTGIASKAERLRIAMKIARQKVTEEGDLVTNKDLLDWIKFAQSETDGVKLDLTTLFEDAASMAGSGQERDDSETDGEEERD